MKTKTLKLTLTGILLISSIAIFAQEQAIEFTYDAAGNRTERNVIELKMPDKSVRDSNREQNAESLEQKNINNNVYTEQLGEKKISIYPNPTSGELTVVIRQTTAHGAGAHGSGQTNARIEVFSPVGEKVFGKNKIGNKTKIDLLKLPDGVYVLKIFIGERSSTWKIVKE